MASEPQSTLPDAAVEAAAVALSAFRTMPGPNMERDARAALAAALSHLIDDAMIERAARELHERECSGRKPWDERPEFHRQVHRSDARAVLEAAWRV